MASIDQHGRRKAPGTFFISFAFLRGLVVGMVIAFILGFLAGCEEQKEYKRVNGNLYVNDPFCYQVGSVPVTVGKITNHQPIYTCRDDWQPIEDSDSI